MSWLDGLEDDFGYRLPSPEGYNVALAVHNAIHSSIPDSGRAPHLVYPIDGQMIEPAPCGSMTKAFTWSSSIRPMLLS